VVSFTNGTGVTQRITGVSVSSNGFTGDVLLDNFQLELAMEASAYTARTPTLAELTTESESRSPRLRFQLPAQTQKLQGTTAGRRRVRYSASLPAASRSRPAALTTGWTVSGWCAVETPPAPDSFACLAAIEREPKSPLQLVLRVEPQKSDENGWVGALEVTSGNQDLVRMPVTLAPKQSLFWALVSEPDGRLTLLAAPTGFRLATASSPATPSAPGARGRGQVGAICLGSDGRGGHPLNGMTGGGRFVPRAMSLDEVEQIRSYPSLRSQGRGG
jgi:hypothetical protein